MKKLITGLLALAVLGACATATAYKPQVNSDGGYGDQQIETNRWAVSFTGNTLTDRQTVESYLLYRAAELTQQNGFDNFQIVSRETDAKSRFLSTGFSSPFYYNFYGSGFHSGFGPGFRRSSFGGRSFGRRGFSRRGFSSFGGFHDPFFGGPSSFSERINYEATAEIVMHKGVKPDDVAFFSASEVLTNLAPTIVLPEA